MTLTEKERLQKQKQILELQAQIIVLQADLQRDDIETEPTIVQKKATITAMAIEAMADISKQITEIQDRIDKAK